jgi:hypothetical protein
MRGVSVWVRRHAIGVGWAGLRSAVSVCECLAQLRFLAAEHCSRQGYASYMRGCGRLHRPCRHPLRTACSWAW